MHRRCLKNRAPTRRIASYNFALPIDAERLDLRSREGHIDWLKLALLEVKPVQVLGRPDVVAADDLSLIVQTIGCRIVRIGKWYVDRRKIPAASRKEPVQLKRASRYDRLPGQGR